MGFLEYPEDMCLTPSLQHISHHYDSLLFSLCRGRISMYSASHEICTRFPCVFIVATLWGLLHSGSISMLILQVASSLALRMSTDVEYSGAFLRTTYFQKHYRFITGWHTKIAAFHYYQPSFWYMYQICCVFIFHKVYKAIIVHKQLQNIKVPSQQVGCSPWSRGNIQGPISI